MKDIFYKLFTAKHYRRGLKELAFLESKLRTSGSRFAVPFVYRGKGFFKSIEPRQNLLEIECLYQEVMHLKPERVLEIGTAKGGTLYLWTQAATPDAVIVSVDLPGGEFGGAYPTCRIPFYESFAREGQKMHLLLADSHLSETYENVARIFSSRSIDFAFIDGDHTYEGVKADFNQYGPLVRPGGLIAFHDILPRPDLPDIQVDKFWKEIKDRYETVEFIGTKESGRKVIGIGLLRVGSEPVKNI